MSPDVSQDKSAWRHPLFAEEKVEALPINDDAIASMIGLFKSASSIPGARIDREKFLRRQLKRHDPKVDIGLALAQSPAKAGVSPETLDSIADACIKFETAKVSSISFAAGLPGGIAAIPAIAADLVQFFVHVIRIEQKLAYVYGWKSFLDEDETGIDKASYLFTLIIGAGTQGTAILGSSAKLAFGLAHKRAARVLHGLGGAMPLLGGALSAGISYSTFKAGTKLLKAYLSELPQAQDEHQLDADILEVEPAVQ